MKEFTNGDTAMANAVNNVYGTAAMTIESNLFRLAGKFSTEYDGGSWAFVCNDDQTLGFWYPMAQDTYDVVVPTNYYSKADMQASAFGAGLTLLIVNQMAWLFNEQGQNTLARQYSEKYHALFNFVFDLGEKNATFIDTVQVAGFID